jgi:hypothetical protein
MRSDAGDRRECGAQCPFGHCRHDAERGKSKAAAGVGSARHLIARFLSNVDIGQKLLRSGANTRFSRICSAQERLNFTPKSCEISAYFIGNPSRNLTNTLIYLIYFSNPSNWHKP